MLRDGQPWIDASDVCAALGLDRTRDALSALDPDEKIRETVAGTLVDFVSESGLYTLVMRSRKPEAREFRRWVTSIVLPSIRKTGRYEAASLGDDLDELEAANDRTARAIQIARAERAGREQAERTAEALAAPAAAWNHLASADGDWSVADAAKILSRDPNIKTGQNRLFTLLYEWGWIFRGGDLHWRANQTKAVDTKRLTVMPASHYHPRTGQLVQDPPQIRVLPKGLVEMHRRLGGSQPLAVQQQLTIEAA
jgi:prophage antirepressor-like protein